MSLIHSTMFIAFLLGAMPSAGGLRNGRLDFGPQGILRLVGVASMYPTRCNSESSFDGSWHQGGLPGGGVWRTRRKTQWTCSPCIPVLGLCRRFLLQRGLGLPAIVPALGPHKPQGPCLPSNVSFSSPGPTAEDGPSRRSHLLAMEPTRPAPLSRYPKSYLGRQTRECQVGGGGDASLFCFGYFKVLNSCLVNETSWLPHSVLHFEQCGGP